MSRTDEQQKADEALNEAIQNSLEAYGISDGMVTDFIILMATEKIVEDDIVVTCHPVLMRDGDLPWYRILGLMEIHRKLAEVSMLSGTDNG